MTIVNKLTNLESVNKFSVYVRKCEAGKLELTAKVINEIDSLLESEDAIFKEMVNLLKRFECTEDEAMCFASERIVEGCQILRAARINYYLNKLEVM